MKKYVYKAALLTSLALATITAPAFAESTQHLTQSDNTAKVSEQLEVQADINAGKSQSATSTNSFSVQSFSKLFDFTFEDVTYTGIDSRNFDVTKSDVKISSTAKPEVNDASGTYHIKLYRNHWYGDTGLTDVTYYYGPNEGSYSYTWEDVGKGEYHFYLGVVDGDNNPANQMIKGNGTVYQQ